MIICNADGRKTIMGLLEGRYIDERLRGYCAEPPDEMKWAVHVFLGVNRDLSREPSALVMLLEKPLVIAGHAHGSLEMQIYGFSFPAGMSSRRSANRKAENSCKKLPWHLFFQQSYRFLQHTLFARLKDSSRK